MMSADDVTAILENESEACSMELELFEAIGKTPQELSVATGRAFVVENLILPNMDGGEPILSHLVRFKPVGST